MFQSSRLLRAVNVLMAAAFLFSVGVQYNDPDPIRWALIYGLAAVACILSLCGRLRWPVPATVGAAAWLWAALLAPRVVGRTALADLFQSFHMINEAVEEAREMGGLLIVAFWMAVLALVSWRAKSRQSS